VLKYLGILMRAGHIRSERRSDEVYYVAVD
jgi:hypothetical protein